MERDELARVAPGSVWLLAQNHQEVRWPLGALPIWRAGTAAEPAEGMGNGLTLTTLTTLTIDRSQAGHRAPPAGSAAGCLWPARAGPGTAEALAGLTLGQ
jgi:hypothetical protein